MKGNNAISSDIEHQEEAHIQELERFIGGVHSCMSYRQEEIS